MYRDVLEAAHSAFGDRADAIKRIYHNDLRRVRTGGGDAKALRVAFSALLGMRLCGGTHGSGWW